MVASVTNLSVRYGKRVAVDDISFELAAGQVTLLLGPNGAGKSTTLSAMTGAILPSAGTIAIDGHNLATAAQSIKQKVGFADQPPALYDYFTVEEHVGFVGETRGADAAQTASMLAELGLAAIAKRPCRELSYGMRQRVGLAAALVGKPSVVLLDETLNGLDPHASRHAINAILHATKHGASVLMSTHLLGNAEKICDRVILMSAGKIIYDLSKADLAARLGADNPNALEELYLANIPDQGPA